MKELSIGRLSSDELESHWSRDPFILPEINVTAIANELARTLSHHFSGSPNALPNVARTGTKINIKKACDGKILSLQETSME